MKFNIRRISILIFLSLLFSLGLANFFDFTASPGFLGVLYTVIGVVFSVGMGMIFSLNPGRIPNKDFYLDLKNSIILVRDTTTSLFFLVSLLYITSQILIDANICSSLNISGVILSLPSFTFSFCCFVLLYYVLNFIKLQNINYEIEELMRSP